MKRTQTLAASIATALFLCSCADEHAEAPGSSSETSAPQPTALGAEPSDVPLEEFVTYGEPIKASAVDASGNSVSIVLSG